MFEAGTRLIIVETMRLALHVMSMYNLRRCGVCFNFSLAVGTVLVLLNVIGLIVSGTTSQDFGVFTFEIVTISTHWKFIRFCPSLVGSY
jgi:hypothetical protein